MHIEFACFYFALILGIKTIITFIHCRSSLEKHTRFLTKIDKVYTRFLTKRAQKPYPMGGTYLYSLYKRVTRGWPGV